MKSKLIIFVMSFIIFPLTSCRQKEKTTDLNIIFLHHSTGRVIWNGKSTSKIGRYVRSKSNRLANIIGAKAQLPLLFQEYNEEHKKNYLIREMIFPGTPYPWINFPYDYYNLWVKNAGNEPFMEQPTLEMLTKEYQVIIFKHCFPVSNILADQDSADINSDMKTILNYKLQYSALRDKLHKFPDTKFILFTGAAQVKLSVTEDEAKRAKEFFSWVTEEWDLPGDNIYLWDLYRLQTEGGLYFRDEYAVSIYDSHPNEEFAGKVVKLLFDRVIDIIENNGNGTQMTGEKNN
jgi:hypothetical protein